MTNSDVYLIKLTPNFETTYRKHLKTYYKKDSNSKKEFELLIEKVIVQLEIDPYSETLSKAEPFPKGCSAQSIQLRKIRWSRLPGLQGASAKGRLLFLIIESDKTVYLLWLYTHQEYPKRPPESDLKHLIKNFQLEKVATEEE